jgi:hypothetical protein
MSIRRRGRNWSAVASSSDGQRLVAVDGSNGQLYTSAPVLRQSTTLGTSGSISGRQYEAITLQYVGANKFVVFDFSGELFVK